MYLFQISDVMVLSIYIKIELLVSPGDDLLSSIIPKIVVNGVQKFILLAGWVVSQGFDDSEMKLGVSSAMFVVAGKSYSFCL